MNEKLLSIAEQFAIEGKIASINALGEGFINDTYVVETEGDAPNYILQRKNHIIFPDVPGMMDNSSTSGTTATPTISSHWWLRQKNSTLEY